MTTRKKKALKELDKLQRLYDALKKEEKKMYAVLPNFHESSYVDAYERLVEFLLDGWADDIGIGRKALSWYIYDTDWGCRAYKLARLPGGDIDFNPGDEDNYVLILTNKHFIDFLFGNEE